MTTTIGTFIRTERKKAKMTLKELSRKAGISYPYLSTIETGKRTNPSVEVLIEIGNVLNIQRDDILAVAGHPATKTISTSFVAGRLLSLHPLKMLMALETNVLAEMLLFYMKRGSTLYHNDLIHELLKGAGNKGSTKEILDLMIHRNSMSLTLDVFQTAIVYQVEPATKTFPLSSVQMTDKIEELKTHELFDFWKDANFKQGALSNYGDYVLSSPKVSTFELNPIVENQTVLMDGRIISPQTLEMIQILLSNSSR